MEKKRRCRFEFSWHLTDFIMVNMLNVWGMDSNFNTLGVKLKLSQT